MTARPKARPRRPSARVTSARVTSARKERAAQVRKRLRETYGEVQCALHHSNAFELLAATILSAQCTDARVNQVTPELFRRWPTPAALARADPAEVEEAVHSTGFFRNKARNLIAMAERVETCFAGEIPAAMADLLTLPGVARKTANVVRGVVFGLADGVVVDTHVGRIAQLLGWTKHSAPVQIERELMALHPQDAWIELSHLLIHHGRQVCIARRPRCGVCTLAELCPSAAKA